MARLELWSVHLGGTPYTAPECGLRCLVGEVYDHEIRLNGSRVMTSDIVSCDKEGGTVTTRSGSIYKLGKPDPLWIKWLKDNGFDSESLFPYITNNKD